MARHQRELEVACPRRARPPVRASPGQGDASERVRQQDWQALDEATGVKDGTRLQALLGELEHAGYEAAARCLADDLPALVVPRGAR